MGGSQAHSVSSPAAAGRGHRDGPSNYTVLQRNVLDALPNEDAQAEFLWACEQTWADRYLYRPEAYAREVERVLTVIDDDVIRFTGSLVERDAPGPVDVSDWNLTDRDNPASLKSFLVKRHRGLFERRMKAARSASEDTQHTQCATPSPPGAK